MFHRASGALPQSSDPRPKSVSRFPEIVFCLLILSLLVIRIIEAHDTFIHQPATDWSISDWMISYAAGFVRRGLGGAFLAALMRLTGLGFFPLLITVTTAAYLSLCFYLLRASMRLHGPAIWRFVLLLSPILIISACDYGTVARKDTIFLFATLLNLSLSRRILARQEEQPEARIRLTSVLLLLFTALALCLALLHEGLFTFLWLPLNAAIPAYVLTRMRWSRRSALCLLALSLLPSLAAVVASAHWHGDAHTSETICRTWRSSMQMSCTPGTDFPVALGALDWSLREAVARSISFAPWFFLYPVIFTLGGALEIIAIRALIPEARLDHLVSLLLFPFVASLPLYVLGIDWGRWLSFVATASLLTMLTPSLRPCVCEILPARIRNTLDHRLVPALDRVFSRLQPRLQREAFVLCAALLLIPIPPIPDRTLALLDPPFVFVTFLIRLFAR